MDGHGFITNMLNAMAKDKKLSPEVSMPELARALFNGKPTNELELIKRLISFREKYKLDYITVLPLPGRPPTVRFWKIEEDKELPEKETKKLPEELNEHNND